MANPITVSFWATEVAPPAGVELDGHPCGSVVRVKTSVVPADSPWMTADTIREIDAAGKTVRSWRVPVDLYPVGIKGDTVVLAHGSDPIRYFTVDQQGHIRIPKESPTNWLQPTNCPGSFANFGCVVIRKNPVRYLVYSLVCT
jgi:hypothetical protein